MSKQLGRTFYTIVRPASAMRDLVEADPDGAFDLPVDAKRVVTFLGRPNEAKLSPPIESDGVRILAINASEVFTAYAPNPRGPTLMTLIEKIFCSKVTTRTRGTVKRRATA